jgi:hypothetical protein
MLMSARVLLAFAAVSIMSFCAEAAQAKEPNITGVWAISPPGDAQQMLQDSLPSLTPAVQAKVQQAQAIARKNNRLVGEAHTKCWPTGMPGMMSTPFGIEFLQTPGRITILNEVSNLPRTIYLDEKTHSDSFIPGWNGNSIGHWENDVLIVDTIGFNGRSEALVIDHKGGMAAPVSEKMHMIEKIYLDKEGYLHDDITMDDPVSFTAPYTGRYRYKRAVGKEANELIDYVCEVDPANLFAFEKEQKDAGVASTYDPAWSIEAFAKPDSAAATATLTPKNPLVAK